MSPLVYEYNHSCCQQQEQRLTWKTSGHIYFFISSKGDRDSELRTVVMCHRVLGQWDLNPGESPNQPWRLSASFHHTMLKPGLTHCTAAAGRGIPNPAPSEPLLWHLELAYCTKKTLLQIEYNFQLCITVLRIVSQSPLTWQPWLKAHMDHRKTLLPPRISSPSSSHQFLMSSLRVTTQTNTAAPEPWAEAKWLEQKFPLLQQQCHIIPDWTCTNWNHNYYLLESPLIYSSPSDTDSELNPPCREKN